MNVPYLNSNMVLCELFSCVYVHVAGVSKRSALKYVAIKVVIGWMM